MNLAESTIAAAPAQDVCIEEKILELFPVGEAAVKAEVEMEASIAGVIRAFYGAARFSSEIPYKSLAASFTDSAIPSEPQSMMEYLSALRLNVIEHSTRTGSPRFIGHMTSQLPGFVAPLAKLIAVMNQNLVKAETAKAATPFERQAIAMIHRLIFECAETFYQEHIQDISSTLGVISSGGTLANLHALWCARNKILAAMPGSSGVEVDGVASALQGHGLEGAVIVGSELMHYSLEKAAGLMGLGTRNLVRVPVDQRNRVDCARMRSAIESARARNNAVIALIGIAGTTDTGAVDPLNELAELAQEFGIHFHVDAAWGGPTLFSRRHRHKLKGIERADSVIVDGHKQLYLPVGVGISIFKDPDAARVVEKQARYIIRPTSVDLGRRTIEGSRVNSALYLHAGLNIIGASGYEYLMDEGIRKAGYMAQRLKSMPEFELLLEPELNIVAYRYIPERFRERAAMKKLSAQDNQVISQLNAALQKKQRLRGRSFVSRTSLTTNNGDKAPMVVLRAVLSNPLTKTTDIDAVIEEQLQIAASLSPSMQT